MASSYLSKWIKWLSEQLTFPTLTSRSIRIQSEDDEIFKHHAVAAQANNAFFFDVDAEPLKRYKKGGYHPTHLGDRFKDGRYQILHKLGWGAYATVWLAKDML